MRVAVTGADGFIGSRLCAELEAHGASVARFGLDPSVTEAIDLRSRTELADYMCAARPELVFHLGGVSGPMIAPDDPGLVAEVNCTGTLNVFEAARLARTKRIIYASSISGFDGGAENDPQPLTVYGATKRFGEMVAAIYRREWGMETTCARIGSVYGRGRETMDVTDNMLSQARREGLVTYSPGAVVPLISVVDLVRTLTKVGSDEHPPESCDLVTETLTERQLALEVAQATGLSASAVIAGEEKPAMFWQWRRSSYPGLVLESPLHSITEELHNL